MKHTTEMRDSRGAVLERMVLRGGLLLLAVLLMSALGGWTRRVRASEPRALLETAAARPGSTASAAALDTLNRTIAMLPLDDQLEAVRGELALVKLQLDRAQAVLNYSSRYRIPGDLSAAIYDIAVSEGIDPAVGFRLVQVESGFKGDAVSHAGALGYTQLQVPTARIFRPRITEQELMDRDTNLRLGFRYLKRLLGSFDYDLRLALLAYNRGPKKVEQILADGGNPGNGYAKAVLKGYRKPSAAATSEVR